MWGVVVHWSMHPWWVLVAYAEQKHALACAAVCPYVHTQACCGIGVQATKLLSNHDASMGCVQASVQPASSL